MKTPAPTKPTIEIMPLATAQIGPIACNTLADLIHALGPRTDIAPKLGMVYRTLNLRMTNPGTATMDELQKLARLANIELNQVLALTAYQLEHPEADVPAARKGAAAHKGAAPGQH